MHFTLPLPLPLFPYAHRSRLLDSLTDSLTPSLSRSFIHPIHAIVQVLPMYRCSVCNKWWVYWVMSKGGLRTRFLAQYSPMNVWTKRAMNDERLSHACKQVERERRWWGRRRTNERTTREERKGVSTYTTDKGQLRSLHASSLVLD